MWERGVNRRKAEGTESREPAGDLVFSKAKGHFPPCNRRKGEGVRREVLD